MNRRETKFSCKNDEFVMKPKVDFCFKELMEDAQIRQGFLAAVLGIPKESIQETMLLPTHLRKQYEVFASCFHLWEDKHREKYSDKLEIRVLELPKLSQYEYPETALLNWAKFINAEKKEEMEKMAQKDDSLKKAYERVLEMSADEKKRLEYEEREKAIRDYNSQMKSNWKSGHKAGVAEGRELGITEGHKSGMEEATIRIYRKLGKTKLEIEKLFMEEFGVEEEEAKRKVSEYWVES